MTNEPTKAAIERACEMQGYRADWYFKGGYYDEVQIAQIETVALHLDQVSETAKRCASFMDQPWISENTKAASSALRGELDAIILPDPEPDVQTIVAQAMSDAMCGVPNENYAQPAADFTAELDKRGYAITKTGETGQ